MGGGWGPVKSRRMCPTFLAGAVGGSLAHVLAGECCVKLKDYEDLEQYSLKNFDLKAYQLSQQQPAPEPIPGPCEPYRFTPEIDSPSPLAIAPDAPSPNQLSPNPWSSVQEQDPCEVQFGQHFTLLQPLYTPFSQTETWKLPRWVVAMVGLFFGSAAVFAAATCVVLLRDPKPAPAEPLAAPTAPVAMTAPVAATSPAPAQHSSSPPMTKASPVRDSSALAHRIAVSRHPSVVRRQIHGPRRVASRSTSSSVALQETETASSRPPQDALDKLLGESSVAGAP